MRRIYLRIPSAAFEELSALAQLELRAPKEQALVLILEGLERRAEFLKRRCVLIEDAGT